MAFILRRVVKYRLDITKSNIKSVFPGIEDSELKQLIKDSYRNLTDIMLEGIKGISLNHKIISERHKVINPEVINQFYDQNKSLILVTGHYNNWEWGAISPSYYVNHEIIGLYKKIKNPLIEKFVKAKRAKAKIKLYELKDTSLAFEKNTSQAIPSLFLMAADQNPSNLKQAIWVKFFKLNTACLHGPEKYARQYDLPIVYCNVQRVKRGYYELELTLLVNYPLKSKNGEITFQFMNFLEKVIEKEPGNWLWSHRRWKHKYEDQKVYKE